MDFLGNITASVDVLSHVSPSLAVIAGKELAYMSFVFIVRHIGVPKELAGKICSEASELTVFSLLISALLVYCDRLVVCKESYVGGHCSEVGEWSDVVSKIGYVIPDIDVIGNTAPRLRYALNVDLNYKNFGLNITGTGRAFYDVALTNEYFWNGWGDDTYSQFVADNIGEAYPRLSYDKSSTNFVASDFWLRKGGFFKLKSVQLSYTLNPKAKWIQSVRFTLTGGNLATITGLEYVDPEDIDAGVTTYPFFRTVMAGVKVSF